MKIDDSDTTIKDLTDLYYAFSKERNWEEGYNPSFLTKSIIIEAAELLEHFQKSDGKASMDKMQDPQAKQAVAWEMVDVLYYLLMLSRILEIDVVQSSKEKLENLASRYTAKRIKTS